MKFIKDDILIIETGDNSDRSWEGPFRILRDFDGAEIAKEYRAKGERSFYSEDEPDPALFGQFLVLGGYVAQVDKFQTVHVGSGSYSGFDSTGLERE